LQRGKIGTKIPEVPGKKTVGLLRSMSTHEKIGDYVLTPGQRDPARRTGDRGLVPTTRALNLRATVNDVSFPRCGCGKRRFGREPFHTDLHIMKKGGNVLKVGEAGSQLGIDDLANHGRTERHGLGDGLPSARASNSLASKDIKKHIGI